MKYSINNYELFFKLNKEEKIVLSFEEPIDRWFPCDNIPIIFATSDQEFLVSLKSIQDSMYILITLLSAALKEKLHLHKSINQDIGFIWNQEMQREPGPIYTKLESNNYWVGLQNLLWATSESVNPIVSTWIYNDSNNAIIFEITPSYPWIFKEPEVYEDFISYDKWLKTYRPLVIREIPKNVAIEWINQAEIILEHLKNNAYSSAE